eukprot:TRINITY_DN337_c0_g1_i1.p1 TRINITY_DN337_c0_g1~~TRINITY_DN337_c0_g1_i1.p1  ORF type:complete len:387 (+),score=80.23 TRINITY_DN337_c0_g1_i1:268-1428(+)
MGIYKLMSLLQEKAPGAIRKVKIDFYSGRTVACDASTAIYQFLVATQGYTNNALTELTDKDGNRTGHLLGLFNRTIQFLENGIKPVWVFDGRPPTLKSGELARRKKVKEEAMEKMEEAKEAGDMEEALKQKTRTVSVSSTMKEDAMRMLRLMGMPVIEAPCEAEAQCASLVKAGKAFATATEDMDSLTFGSTTLLRGFNSKGEPIIEIGLAEALKELELSYEEFVDLCILCGCDYADTIDGVGPVTAYKLIKAHNNIEGVLKQLEEDNKTSTRKRKFLVPARFPFEDCRELFKRPVVADPSQIELKWEKPSDEDLKKFLCEEKGFSIVRVENALKKIKIQDTKGFQSRLDAFFGKPTVIKRKEGPASAAGSDSKKGTKRGRPSSKK